MITPCRQYLEVNIEKILTFGAAFKLARKLVNAKPGLKVNQGINFSYIQLFFTAMCCLFWGFSKSKQKAKQYKQKISPQNYKNSNLNSRVSLMRFGITRLRSSAFSWLNLKNSNNIYLHHKQIKDKYIKSETYIYYIMNCNIFVTQRKS